MTTKHINRIRAKKFQEKMGGSRRHAKLFQVQKQRNSNAGVYQQTTHPADAQIVFASVAA